MILCTTGEVELEKADSREYDMRKSTEKVVQKKVRARGCDNCDTGQSETGMKVLSSADSCCKSKAEYFKHYLLVVPTSNSPNKISPISVGTNCAAQFNRLL
ncbi:hypothetical protein J6590_001586 [Homalodisca vitripennis]|nr:hypothetical protein J6590_001586 [Homalodisca vitripennis]